MTIVITLACVLLATATYAQIDAPNKLRLEYLESPVWGMDVAQPRFSWANTHSARGEAQTAYEIVLLQAGADFWTSDQVNSSQTTQTTYSGPSLSSDTSYSWTVRWWDSQGNISPYSEPFVFHTGFFDGKLPGATWVSGRNQFRKEFQLQDEVTQATVFIIGLGYYILEINGEKVGDAALGQFTTFQKRVLYDTYDVTNLIKRDNAVAVSLGNGWYAEPSVNVGPRSLLFYIRVTLASGAQFTLTSDETWKTVQGPIIADNIYQGETYDARLETTGWEYFGYNDTLWDNATAVAGPAGVLSAQMNPLIKKVDTYTPIAVTQPKPGVWVFDFGQNVAGWARFTGSGAAGTNISMVYSEMLSEDGTTRDMYGIAETATYIFRGDDQETYEPSFTYFGFQFVEMTGYVGVPTIETMEGYFIHTALPETGEINFDSTLLNQIQHATRFASLSNFMNVPTDCPQRERRGWLGDAQLSAETTIHNFDMGAAYTKFIRDIYDSQNWDATDGQVPDCVPFYGHGGIPADPAWGTAYTLIWHWMYEYYGDTTILSKYYTGVKAYVEAMYGLAKNNILEFSRYGDWCSAVDGMATNCGQPSGLYSTFYLLLQIEKLADAASVLGNTADVTRYTGLANTIRAAWNPRFYHNDTSTYDFGYQASQSLALWLNTTDPSNTQAVFNELLNDISQHDTHLTSGIVGIKYLMLTLSEMGRTDIAYEIATQNTFPSWGYMIEQGATTLWENWQTSAYVTYGSKNHIMYGSQSAWYYQWLGGIRQNPGSVAYDDILIAPRADQIAEKFVATSISTPKGLIVSEWTEVNGGNCQVVAENSVMAFSCGGGGTIQEVVFASFGTPTGSCDNFTIDDNCNAKDSVAIIEKACVGKSSCSITANDVTFGDPCPNTVKQLAVQLSGCVWPVYQHAVTIPVGSVASVVIPKFAASGVSISESSSTVWQNGAYVSGVAGITGAEDIGYGISIRVGSGSYSFQLFGNVSETVCGSANENEDLLIQCPVGHVVSEVQFASFGDTPSGECGAFKASGCSAGSAKHVVETECFGKNSCTIDARAGNFMTRPVCNSIKGGRTLTAQVSCSRS